MLCISLASAHSLRHARSASGGEQILTFRPETDVPASAVAYSDDVAGYPYDHDIVIVAPIALVFFIQSASPTGPV